jgi:diguanylate cyclase (GGDEF)-like protein/PAS domain S-box-containing protein
MSNTIIRERQDSGGSRQLLHLLYVMLTVVALMSAYEIVKQLIKPSITIWQSHLINVMFSGIAATVAAYFILNKYEKINCRLRKEINDHKQTEDEKEQYRETLEKMVRKRTAELTAANVKLHDEIADRAQIVEALLSSEEKFRKLVESISDWVWEIDENYAFMYSSPKVEDMLGYETCEILGKTPFDLMTSEEASGISEIFHNFASFKQPFAFIENVNLHKSGHQVTLETGGAPIFDKGGKFRGYRGISRDISDRKLAEDALRESEATLRGFFNANAIQMSVIELDRDDFIYVMPNKRIADFFGLRLEEMSGKSARELGLSDELIRHWVEVFGYFLENRETLTFEYEFPYKGREYWYQGSISLIYDSMSARPRFSFAAVDITESKRAEREVQHLAYFDSLTGLPNRALLNDRLAQVLAQSEREDWHVGILFLDIDRFKWINDTQGHSAGDKLLQAVAERLQKRLRTSDTVARLGGDEFVIVLSAVKHVQDISHVTQEIMEALSAPFELGEQEVFISASIGIAIFPLDGNDVGSLLRNADTAMYVAKESGRNNYKFFSREMNLRAVERITLETNMRRALERGEFSLNYQPQVDMKNGGITGMEALLRWNHPETGFVSPGKFIPIAEETGLIIPIGEWVMRTACGQAKSLIDAGFPSIRMAVNISGCQFKQSNLAKVVRQVLEETGLSPASLELELTESILMDSADCAVNMLQELKAIGVHLAIDDFGTGYSSLTYLKNFPIDRLKIDQLFIRDITTNTDDASISNAIIAMAHSLGMRVIAEGVETKEQMEFLASRDCHEMQGYYFSRPVSREEIRHILENGLVVENISIFPFRQFSKQQEIQRMGRRANNFAVLAENISAT